MLAGQRALIRPSSHRFKVCESEFVFIGSEFVFPESSPPDV